MASNDFLPFAGGVGSNVLTQAAYAALAARTAGFSAGVAKSAELNKVWRQSSLMTAALAQFAADQTGLDMLDDGSTAILIANIKAAVKTLSGAQVFNSSGSFTVPPGVTQVRVTAVAGGGGSGSSLSVLAGTIQTGASGGGAGQSIVRQSYAVTPGQVIAITIGVGGSAAPAGGANGGAGGNTIIGSLVTLTGGSGGVLSNTAVAPAIPNAVLGGAGFPRGEPAGTVSSGGGGGGRGGAGGSSIFGQGGFPAPGTNGGATGGGTNAAANTGAGGGGAGGSFGTAASVGATGGAGGSGCVIFEW